MLLFYCGVVIAELKDGSCSPKERKKGANVFSQCAISAELPRKKNADAAKPNKDQDYIDRVDDEDLPDNRSDLCKVLTVVQLGW